jgi:hypothetical protein
MNDVEERMQEVARTISVILPPGTGFTLLAFDLNKQQGRAQYISNANKSDAIKLMREFIEKAEKHWGKHLP